jgi:hypothetical protein
MKFGMLAIVAMIILMTLGGLLYFSASAFLNVLVIPLLQDLTPEQADKMIALALVIISFLASLIAGFFSVFLFEMAGGGYRPLLMGTLFSLPVIAVQIYVVIAGNMPTEMMVIYLLESLMILLAFVLTAFAGRWVARRFFSNETGVDIEPVASGS